MYPILKKELLAPNTKLLEVSAPLIAAKAMAGNFVMVRIDEKGERIPLTIADYDRTRGTIDLVFQEVGTTTKKLGSLEVGENVLNVMGPAGKHTEVEKFGHVVCVAGGLGVAPIFPIVRAMKEAGNKVTSIIGARSKDLLIFEGKLRQFSDEIIITTDDGSMGRKGFVTDALKDLIEKERVDRVITIGPVPMMAAVAKVTSGIKTVASLNSMMFDGTGMCGGCRVRVGGEIKFTCIDGPEFDAHEVDFDELVMRQKAYVDEEKHSLELYEGGCACGK